MEVVSIPISSIAKRAEWQVRSGLDKGAVRRYQDAYIAGSNMPPVRLAKTENALFVIDGWHRLAAAGRAGLDMIDATIEAASSAEAAWLAAEANLCHGVPLKRGEHRKVFRAFIRAGKHRRGKNLIPYREIAKALHGVRAHTTIRNWMREDFPTIAEAYGPAEPHGNPGADATWAIPSTSDLSAALEHLHSLAAIRDALPTAQREALTGAIRYRLGPEWETPEPKDF